jgi:hypothetical protein
LLVIFLSFSVYFSQKRKQVGSEWRSHIRFCDSSSEFSRVEERNKIKWIEIEMERVGQMGRRDVIGASVNTETN